MYAIGKGIAVPTAIIVREVAGGATKLQQEGMTARTGGTHANAPLAIESDIHTLKRLIVIENAARPSPSIEFSVGLRISLHDARGVSEMDWRNLGSIGRPLQKLIVLDYKREMRIKVKLRMARQFLPRNPQALSEDSTLHIGLFAHYERASLRLRSSLFDVGCWDWSGFFIRRS